MNQKKLRYIKYEDIKEKSVYYLAFNFINEFIQKLNSKSLLFYPLLLIDNGINYFGDDSTNNNDTVYGFGMDTLNNIKIHLNDLIPEAFFEYEDNNNEINAENGFNYKGYGAIFLNKARLLKGYNKSPELYEYKNDEEKIESKSYAVKISKTLKHESFCYNNYIYDSPKGIQSPIKFFNNKNKLVNILPKDSNCINNQLILKCSQEFGKGESGKFFEYFFGLYEGKLIIDLIFEINDISKLYDSIDYYVKESLDDIKKYITMKYILRKKGINYTDSQEISLSEENKKLENLCSKNKENITTLYDTILKSSDTVDNFYFISESDKEIKGYDYYLEKAFLEKDIIKKLLIVEN